MRKSSVDAAAIFRDKLNNVHFIGESLEEAKTGIIFKLQYNRNGCRITLGVIVDGNSEVARTDELPRHGPATYQGHLAQSRGI